MGETPGHLGPEPTGQGRGCRVGERQGPRRLQRRPWAQGPASGLLPSRHPGQDSQLPPTLAEAAGTPMAPARGQRKQAGVRGHPRSPESASPPETKSGHLLRVCGAQDLGPLRLSMWTPQLCLPQLKSPVSLHLPPHPLEMLFSDDRRNSQGGWERRGWGASRGGQGQGGSPGQPARTCSQEPGTQPVQTQLSLWGQRPRDNACSRRRPPTRGWERAWTHRPRGQRGPGVTPAQVRGTEGQAARRGCSPGLVPADPGGRGGGGSDVWTIRPHGEESTCCAGAPGLTPGWGRSPGDGSGSPLQCPCLDNPVDRGAWRATVHGSQRIGHD